MQCAKCWIRHSTSCEVRVIPTFIIIMFKKQLWILPTDCVHRLTSYENVLKAWIVITRMHLFLISYQSINKYSEIKYFNHFYSFFYGFLSLIGKIFKIFQYFNVTFLGKIGLKIGAIVFWLHWSSRFGAWSQRGFFFQSFLQLFYGFLSLISKIFKIFQHFNVTFVGKI